MTSEFEIHKASPDDARPLLDLQSAAFSLHKDLFDVSLWASESPEELLADLNTMTVLVARTSGGAIVGSIRGRALEGVWLIRKLSVSPLWQKKGVGSALLSAIESAAPESCHKISLCTMLVLGENVRFFLNNGYLPDFLMPDHYNRLHLICFHKKPEKDQVR